MKRRQFFLFIAAGLAMISLSCAPSSRSPRLNQEQQLELQTLTSQLTGPDRTPRTRFEAAQLLLKQPYPQAKVRLVDTLKDTTRPQARIAVAEAIAMNAGASADFIAPLEAMAVNEIPAVRSAAAKALVTYHNHGATDRLVAIAADASLDRDVRLTAIDALQRVVSPQAIQALIDLLDDPDQPIRQAAGNSLATLTGRADLGTSQRQWRQWWQRNRRQDRQGWLRNLADSLARAKLTLEKENAQLRERLVRAMQDNYNTATKAQRGEILQAMFADPISDIRLLGLQLTDKMLAANEPIGEPIVARVAGLLDDPDRRVRQAAAVLTASLAGEKAVDPLLKRLRVETAPTVRVGLLLALGQMVSQRAFLAVLSNVRSEDDAEAAAAAAAVGRLAGELELSNDDVQQAADVLLARYRQASDEADALREALLLAMGTLARTTLREVMIEALADPSGVIRLAGIRGLRKLGDPQAAAAIEPLLSDPDRGIRQAATTALVQLAGEDYLGRIVARTDPAQEADPTVRKEATEAVLTLASDADTATLDKILQRLATTEETRPLRVAVYQQYIDALRAARSDALPDALIQLGEILLASGRPDEAVPVFTEAHQLLAQEAADSPKRQRLQSLRYEAMLDANDPAVVQQIFSADSDKTYQQRFSRLRIHVRELIEQGDTLSALALLEAVLDLDDPRLDEKRRESLQGLRRQAVTRQQEADRRLVEKLMETIQTGDVDARAEAEEQITALGSRALPILLDHFKRAVAENGESRLGATLYELIKQIEPTVGPYDPAASRAERMQQAEAITNSLTGD